MWNTSVVYFHLDYLFIPMKSSRKTKLTLTSHHACDEWQADVREAQLRMKRNRDLY